MYKIILFIYIMELVINEKEEQMPELFGHTDRLVSKVSDNFEAMGVEDGHGQNLQMSEIPKMPEEENIHVEQKEETPQPSVFIEEEKEELTRAANHAVDLENTKKLIKKEKDELVAAEAALVATKAKIIGGAADQFANQAAKNTQIKLDEKKIAEEEIDVRMIDSNLAKWTRMDLFPGLTREKVYPRTVHQRIERKDFLARGMGKIYPFGHKNQHQMSGVGGDASDVIKLRRLYGRNKIAKNDGTEEVKPRKMGRLFTLT
jgi:hypothetical protein